MVGLIFSLKSATAVFAGVKKESMKPVAELFCLWTGCGMLNKHTMQLGDSCNIVRGWLQHVTNTIYVSV